MGFFGNLFDTTKNLGKEIGGAIGTAADKTGLNAKTSLQISALEMERGTLNKNYENLCTTVGSKYVEYLLNGGNPPDVSNELSLIRAAIQRMEEINNNIVALELVRQSNKYAEDFKTAQEEYLAQKKKLDEAFLRGIINQNEYDAKILPYKNRVDKFDEVQRIKLQYDMGLIKKAEMTAKLTALGVNI